MKFKVERVEKYGQIVFQHKGMDEERKLHCLCLNCIKMGICSASNEGYAFCVKHKVAYAMTRCPEWVGKEEK